MRFQHTKAFADVLRSNPTLLAQELHSTLTASKHEFTTEQERDAYAEALRATGTFHYGARFTTAVEAIVANHPRPVCKTCGSDQITRDGSASWDILAQDWSLFCVDDAKTCANCGAEGSDISVLAPTGSVGKSASEPDTGRALTGPRSVSFSYLVPVHVEVEDGLVSRVTVIDETPVRNPAFVEGNAAYLSEALAAANNGQDWPSWSFGY